MINKQLITIVAILALISVIITFFGIYNLTILTGLLNAFVLISFEINRRQEGKKRQEN